LAAFARVGQTDWLAIVQERRDTAIEPVQNVNRIFARAGVVAIIVFGVLLAVLWYFLNRASSKT
jgi:heme/copper-type cytochrome/quinol oxidase subunit 2